MYTIGGKMTYYQELNEVYQELKTSEKGLSSEEAKKRIEEYGPNEIREKKKTSPIRIFFSQFHRRLRSISLRSDDIHKNAIIQRAPHHFIAVLSKSREIRVAMNIKKFRQHKSSLAHSQP